jgi:TolB-like protein
MSRHQTTANTIFYSDLESKLSELVATHQRFQEITDQTRTTDSLMNDIINKLEKTNHVYATYTKIIGYLESGCAAAGLSAEQTLFRIYGDDLINEKANRKFSLGVFIIKFSEYHLAIPVKMAAGGYGNDNTVYIFKPLLVESRFDGRKAVNIPAVNGFANRYGKETARLMTIEISEDVEELSKAQMKTLKTAITTAMTNAEKTMAAAATPQAHVATAAN